MLKKLLISAATLVLASCGSPQEEVTRTVHIEIDNSDSSKIVEDEAFARTVAVRIGNEIMALPLGTYVSVRSFGEINGNNNLRYRARLTKRDSPPEMVAREVAQIITGLAADTSGRQGSTEIITTLQTGEYDCAGGDSIWLLSDGIETGRVNSPSALLSGDERLPEAQEGILEGCSDVAIFGFARTSEGGLTSGQVDTLQSEWNGWMDIAGAVNFRTIINP